MRSGKSPYLEPGIIDIQAAIAPSKTLTSPPPATQAQLCEHGVQLNNWGLLEPLSKELESPDSNDNNTFAWAPHPRILALPPAIIEELDEGDASCSEDNDETDPPNPSPSTQGPADGNNGTLEHVSTSNTAAIQGSASGEDGSAESSSAGGTTTTTTRGLTKGTGEKPSDKRAKARRKYEPTTQHSDEVESGVQDEENDIEINSGSGVEPSAHFSNHDINAATILEDIFARLGYNVKQKFEDLSSKGYLELDGVFSW
ncbi:hypothetical protein MferCBS31731_003664 [Microsporum ferrugineum]